MSSAHPADIPWDIEASLRVKYGLFHRIIADLEPVSAGEWQASVNASDYAWVRVSLSHLTSEPTPAA